MTVSPTAYGQGVGTRDAAGLEGGGVGGGWGVELVDARPARAAPAADARPGAGQPDGGQLACLLLLGCLVACLPSCCCWLPPVVAMQHRPLPPVIA